MSETAWADRALVYDIGMRLRFRGIERRRGMIVRGDAGWAEWSPFEDYDDAECRPWLRAAREAADVGFPARVRDAVAVNCTVPATDPQTARELVLASGCGTAKVKVAERGQGLGDDIARVEAVRDAIGPSGRVRVDANGAWDVDAAMRAIAELRRFELEYVEQPCARVEELAELRRRLARAGIDVRIAADESIRRSGDPERVVALAAADVAVIKVQPLGGVRACLELAERLGLPVVVSSALETSIGLRAGLALAAALPELPFACGLNTAVLLSDDLVTEPLLAVDGAIQVRDVELDPAAVDRSRADAEVTGSWHERRARVAALVAADEEPR